MGPMAVLDDYHSVAVGGRSPSALNIAHVLGSPVNGCTDTRVARVGIIASSQCIHQASVIRPIRSLPALAACTGDDLNSPREILKYRPYLLWVPLIPLPFSQSPSARATLLFDSSPCPPAISAAAYRCVSAHFSSPSANLPFAVSSQQAAGIPCRPCVRSTPPKLPTLLNGLTTDSHSKQAVAYQPTSGVQFGPVQYISPCSHSLPLSGKCSTI